jgi:ubiquinone biosynthesis protein
MSDEPRPSGGVWKSLPRRERLLREGMSDAFEHPPQMAIVSFKARIWRTIGRLLHFSCAALIYFFRNLLARLRGRNTQERRAVHLREAFESVGGTAIKLGQQLSIRSDILPYAYCRELSALLDDVEPFSAVHAAQALRQACGKEIQEIFSAFDPEPIGSASIACVFQARLKDGDRVAVKVRRPRIGEVFAADLRAFGWIARFLEFLTILRPGFSAGIRKGIRSALMEELDFRRELRYQELFRRTARARKKGFITAPRVYPEFSGASIIVMELVTSGLKVSEVLAAVDQPATNSRIVRKMIELNIKPKLIAKRLLWANYAGMITDPFFHGDPSPGNIFVQRKSRLMFIDFGSCGAFSQSQRRALKQINYHQALGDAEGMAAASLNLLEPLPPVDIDAFSNELEELYRGSLYAMASKHAHWWERTTAVQWYQFMGAALAYKLPLPAVILRMARATLLYDTIAARLDPDIVFYEEYRRYERHAMKTRGREVRAQVKDNLAHGLDDRHFAVLEKAVETGNRIIYRIQRLLDLQPLKFVATIEKSAFAVMSLLRLGLTVTFVTAFIVAGAMIADSIKNHRLIIDFWLVWSVLFDPWYLLSMSVLVLYTLRRIFIRLQDKPPRSARR